MQITITVDLTKNKAETVAALHNLASLIDDSDRVKPAAKEVDPTEEDSYPDETPTKLSKKDEPASKKPRTRRTKAQIAADEAAAEEAAETTDDEAEEEEEDTFADEPEDVPPPKAAKAAPKATAPRASATAKDSKYTDEDVRVAFRKFVVENDYPSAQKIMKKFGVGTIKELKPEQYAAAIKAVGG